MMGSREVDGVAMSASLVDMVDDRRPTVEWFCIALDHLLAEIAAVRKRAVSSDKDSLIAGHEKLPNSTAQEAGGYGSDVRDE
jgi:hypothetical protein